PRQIPRANLNLPSPKAEKLPEQVLPIWIADPPLLQDPLAILQALKPLFRQMETGTGRYLDEEKTVDFIARTGLWLPRLEPEREAWFDIVLVADRGSSMEVWGTLVADLARILRHYGIFRDVLVADLVIDPTATKKRDRAQLRTHPDRPCHGFQEFIEQRSRRIAIVVSDCVGIYWWDGTVLPLLQRWGKAMPTMIWQVLPEWMWERTALGQGTAVSLRNDRPGVANTSLAVSTLDSDDQEELNTQKHRVPVPVVTSAVSTLANWSAMLTGDRREATPGYLLPQAGGRVPQRSAQSWEDLARARLQDQDLDNLNPQQEQEELQQILYQIARERIQRFRQLSSPTARRLLTLLAASPVITLPVVRLLRMQMLDTDVEEEQSPLPVAEVFLSGLLQRLPEQEQIQDRQQIQYDFISPVRDVLLEALPEGYVVEVINRVSAEIERRWYQTTFHDFRAFLTNPDAEAPPGLEELRSFATLTADILDRLGGNYRQFAQELRSGQEDLSHPHETGFEPYEITYGEWEDEELEPSDRPIPIP
ncbi:MAG: SAV_2336 N-terminal domain-related protein, partial [Prochlorotrichaceae cyanobacterium]